MWGKLRQALRFVGFQLGFAVFGSLCLGLTFVVFPLQRLTTRSREQRELRAQRMVQWAHRVFIASLHYLDVADVAVTGQERLRAPGAKLLVANHPSLIDVCVIGALFPQLDCVAKKAAWSNPFMLGVVRGTGYLANDDGVALVEAGRERLAQGRSLLLFPEGTRSPAGDLHPFQRGAAHLALRAEVPITPIVLQVVPRGLHKDRRWWEFPATRMRITMEICDPIEPAELVEPGDPRARAARRITAALRDFYVKRLH